MLTKNHSAVLLCCSFAGDGRAGRISLRNYSGDAPRGVFRGDAANLWISRQKATTLIERHRMRLDHGYTCERRARTTNQIVIDWNDDFAGNIQLAIQQQVIASMNETGQTVFDGRQNAICGLIV